MGKTGSTAQASRNGHVEESVAHLRTPADTPSTSLGLLGRLAASVKEVLASRIPVADLDERDPDYIRENLPWLWLLSSIYFRGEVRGLGHIPEEGPVLLVGNHSGGNLTPDTGVLTLAFAAYFGVERAFHQLAHNLVLSAPGLPFVRKFGTVAASPENARKALDSGAALLVYPGGDYACTVPPGRAGASTSRGARGSCAWPSSRTSPWCRWWPSAVRRRRSSLREGRDWPAR